MTDEPPRARPLEAADTPCRPIWRNTMTKKLALAVFASSFLFACGGGEKDDNCTYDEAAACAGKQCGNVSVQDSCGKSHTLTCGTCTGDNETCQNNMCVSNTGPICEVSDADKAAACADKCGTVQAYDSCNNLVDVDCGTDCGEGNICNERTNACMSEAECLLSDAEKASYCPTNSCGAAGTKDKCDRDVYFDCANAENVYEPLNDFAEVYNADGDYYVSGLYNWDSAGKQRVILADIEEDEANVPEGEEPSSRFVAVVFKPSVQTGTEVKLTPITLNGNSFECKGDACVLIANNIAPDYYYYGAVDGTVTISADKKTFEVKNAHLADLIESSCYLKAASFTLYKEPRDCSGVDPMADFADNLDQDDDNNDYYDSDLYNWDSAGKYKTVLSEIGEDMFAGVIYKSGLTDGEHDVTPIILSDTSFECKGDICILIANNTKNYYYYTATSGKVTVNKADKKFIVSNAVFTDLLDDECVTGAQSMIFWDAPGDCTALYDTIAADFGKAKINGENPIIIDSDASVPDDDASVDEDDASVDEENDASVDEDDAGVDDENDASVDENNRRSIITKNAESGIDTYISELGIWDEKGTYKLLSVPGATSNHSFFVIYKASADLSAALTLSPVTLDTSYNFVVSGDAAVLAMNNSANGYYYTAKSGTVTLTTENGDVTGASVSDAIFTDILDDACILAATGTNVNFTVGTHAEYCSVMSPLGDFQDALDTGVGYHAKWDSAGVYGLAAVDGINAFVKSQTEYDDNSLNVVFKKAALTNGSGTLNLTAITTNENSYVVEDAALLIMDLYMKGDAGQSYYSYTATEGALTITADAAGTTYSVVNAEIVDMDDTDDAGAFLCEMGQVSFSFTVPAAAE